MHNFSVVLGVKDSSNGGNGAGYQGPVEVVLVDVGKRPKVVAMMFQRVLNLTITDLKALGDATPLTLYKSLPRVDAEQVRRRFAGVGASVEFRVPRDQTSGITKPFSSTQFAA